MSEQNKEKYLSSTFRILFILNNSVISYSIVPFTNKVGSLSRVPSLISDKIKEIIM